MNFLINGWFFELSPFFPGQAFGIKVKEVLFEGKSKFQDILIFKSESFGRVLALDGLIQLTERDEPFYQEMLAHLPLSVHPNPRRVLIIGGGDGGVARETAMNPCVEHIDLVDIDEMVIDMSRKYLPFTASGLDHSKVSVHVTDGFEFLKQLGAVSEKYDIIITDSTDPGGPSTPLFNKEYFQLLNQALTDDGIICNQGETMFVDLATIQRLMGYCAEAFPNVEYAYNIVPSYTCGHIGYIIACKNKSLNLRDPIREPLPHCKFYTRSVHKAAFVLPKCYEDVLRPVQNA